MPLLLLFIHFTTSTSKCPSCSPTVLVGTPINPVEIEDGGEAGPVARREPTKSMGYLVSSNIPRTEMETKIRNYVNNIYFTQILIHLEIYEREN